MKRVLVCGATGFIGRNLTDRLRDQRGLDVWGVYHSTDPARIPGVSWMEADLTREEDVARMVRGMDVVGHAAATTSGAKDTVERPHYHVTDNAVMGSLIFRAAHLESVGHVIFPSCTVMYPSSPEPARERDFNPGQPMHPRYFGVGWTKVYLEKMCEFYAGLGTTSYTVMRHSNVYGPYDKFDLERAHVFGATINKVVNARDGDTITIWGDGSAVRDLLYVDDLVRFVVAAIERQRQPFLLCNVGSGNAVTVNELVKAIITASGKSLRTVHDVRKPHIDTQVSLNVERAARELGWRPEVSLEEGIRRTLEWYRRTLA